MSYKLMAVDVDGTLLDSNSNLTEATKEAIRLGIENGLIFTISTGRPIQGVEYLNEMLNIDLPFITYNGAMVVMGKSKEILYEQNLSAMDCREIMKLGQEYNTTVMIWSCNNLYVTEINDRTNKYKQISRVEPVLLNTPEEIEQVLMNGASKMLWYDDIDKIEQYQIELRGHLDNRVNYHTSQPFFLEFVNINASKAIAMQKLGEHYDIKQSEMIAIGDGYNDLSMIEYAGLGVVMANANDDIKAKADYITLSNDQDGVAHVIYKYVIGK